MACGDSCSTYTCACAAGCIGMNPSGPHQENTSNKIMGLNQYLDRMNTKTSFILILGCIDVCIGEANRKSLMEKLHFHAKMNILAYDSTTSL